MLNEKYITKLGPSHGGGGGFLNCVFGFLVLVKIGESVSTPWNPYAGKGGGGEKTKQNFSVLCCWHTKICRADLKWNSPKYKFLDNPVLFQCIRYVGYLGI